MQQFKVVRTFMGEKGRDRLQEAFDAGYVLVRASEFVPDASRNNSTYLGYIEYILAKEDPEETYEAGYKKGFNEGCVHGEEKGKTTGYFEGQAYGWEEGRKALCGEICAEIEERIAVYDDWQTQRECTATEASTMREALAIVKKYMAESEGK